MKQVKLRIWGALAMAAGFAAGAGWQARAQAPVQPATATAIDPARVARARELVKLARAAIGDRQSMLLDIAREDIAVTEASLGDVAAARKTVDSISEPSYVIEALVAVAEVQSAGNDGAGARETLALAVKKLSTGAKRNTTMAASGPAEDLGNLRTIGVAEARIGDVAAAGKIAAPMRDSWQKAEIIANVARGRVRMVTQQRGAQAFEDAAAVLHKSSDRFPWFEPRDLVRFQYAAGDAADAEKTIREITDKPSMAAALCVLGNMQAAKGEAAAARSTLNTALEVAAIATFPKELEIRRPYLLINIAQGFAAIKDPAAKDACAQAFKHLDSLPRGTEGRYRLAILLANTAGKIGDKATEDAAARDAADTLKMMPQGNRAHALWELAGMRAEDGDANAARAAVQAAMKEGAIDPAEIALQSRGIAAGIVMDEGAKANLDWIAKLPDADERALAYAAAGAAMAGNEGKK